MKFRILPLVLSSFIFLNAVGIYLFAFSAVGIHRLTERMKDNQMKAKLVLSVAEFKKISWLGDRDFVFNGNVYDMQSATLKNGSVTINCSSDKEETSIHNDLASSIDNGGKNSPTSNPLKDLFKMIPVFPNENSAGFTVPSGSGNAVQFSNTTSVYSLGFFSVNAPPPERV